MAGLSGVTMTGVQRPVETERGQKLGPVPTQGPQMVETHAPGQGCYQRDVASRNAQVDLYDYNNYTMHLFPLVYRCPTIPVLGT